MIYRVYIIPLSGSQGNAGIVSERSRVGNIFDTARQGLMLTQNLDTGESTSTMVDEIDTFTKITTPANERHRLGTSGINQSCRSKTAAYTIVSTDHFVTATANTFAFTLLSAASIGGREYTLSNTGTGVISINTTGGETINGVASGILTLIKNDNIVLVSDGTNWIKTN